jgi:methionyl-tRNA synthetase
MDTITIDDFAKIDLRVGTITSAESIPKSKLLKLSVSFGAEIGTKTILAGIASMVPFLLDGKVENMEGTQVLAVLNLPPREMKGIVSEGMLLATQTAEGKLVLASCLGAPDGAKLG